MSRLAGLTASCFAFLVTGVVLFLWFDARLVQSEVVIPVQALAKSVNLNGPPVSPDEALKLLSVELEARAVPLSNQNAFADLSYGSLDNYMKLAMSYPMDFFSADFEATSLQVAVAWIQKQKQKRRIFTRDAWANCLKLRWSLPQINDLIKTCQALGRWSAPGFSEDGLTFASKRFRIEKPDKQLVKLQRRYIRNPYNAGVLEELSLALARHGAIDVARELAFEMLQFDIDRASRLEQELARMQGYSHPWTRFDS